MKKNRLKIVILIILISSLVSCGIDDFYFLPQVPDHPYHFHLTLNTEAIINLPPIVQMMNSYQFNLLRPSYVIFYRIYISDFNAIVDINTPEARSSVSPTLQADFVTFFPFTNPDNHTLVTHDSTFLGRHYYELELDQENDSDVFSDIVTSSGGIFTINFQDIPGIIPTISFIDPILEEEIHINLMRHSQRANFAVRPDDYFFFYTDELVDETSFTGNINHDVNLRTGGIRGEAFVSMYLVIRGSNPVNFQPVLGKPTHIGIFKLPHDI
ncbi:MAG: hypothetical protein LBC80_04850 [Treponema sp.]|jgi:hypothetical protein|nr:hypothetical protein [Treponema sp.]